MRGALALLDALGDDARPIYLERLKEQGILEMARRFGLYRFCTEDVACYLPALAADGARCLTVAASGDQAVNLLMAGAAEIVAYDAVDEAGCMLDLKTAALSAYEGDDPGPFRGNFDDWLKPGGYGRIERDLGLDAEMFFEKVAVLRHDTGPGVFRPYLVTGRNAYIASAEAFAAARTAVRAARAAKRISFVNADVRTLPYVPSIGTFDVIVTSNIVTDIVETASRGAREISVKGFRGRSFDPVAVTALVRSVTWPLAGLLRPGGRMQAGYVYSVPYRDENDTGEGEGEGEGLQDDRCRAEAFAPPPGFTMEEIRTESRNGEAGGEDVVVIYRRDAA